MKQIELETQSTHPLVHSPSAQNGLRPEARSSCQFSHTGGRNPASQSLPGSALGGSSTRSQSRESNPVTLMWKLGILTKVLTAGLNTCLHKLFQVFSYVT